jgi:hypothetical protein
MTDTNPRDLLIEHDELLAKLSDVLWDAELGNTLNGLKNAAQEVDAAVERLHNFLSQPEPEGLTDRKLEELADDYMVMDGSNGTMHLEHLDFAHAAIAADRALCARPAIKPVPVSEQLPGPEDCDAEGRCWWGRPSEELCNSDWFLATRAEVDEFCDAWPPIVWAPHWAFPVPIKAS